MALVIYEALMSRSEILPRFLGLLYGFAGLFYLANCTLFFLDLGFSFFSILLLVCLVGQSAFTLWLLVAGVDEAKWRAITALSPQVEV